MERRYTRGNMMRSSIQICERRRYNTGTYLYGTPGILCRGRLLHDKIRARKLRPRSPRFCRKFADSLPPSSLSGFLIAFLFSLRRRRRRLAGSGMYQGKKEVEVHAGVDIDIWFRISGSNQIRGRTTAATPI